ncbi:hypothetical protein BpHYR1_010160 [Brachionus plicatilis]|uniref:Uncharacterized protein n=1 Tax=Brachionus plicatilis TaxID=10195 RepID=A0A3M7PXJ8_BRAPC|nr:hypothetical protein BpHYR1_010160 [Brachionus plicatilis]
MELNDPLNYIDEELNITSGVHIVSIDISAKPFKLIKIQSEILKFPYIARLASLILLSFCVDKFGFLVVTPEVPQRIAKKVFLCDDRFS